MWAGTKKRRRLLHKALTLKPNDPDAYFNLGIAYVLEKYEDALSAFKQAVRLKPDWPEALNALGDTQLSLAQYAEAVRSYEATIRLQKDNATAYSNLGFAYDKLGKLSEAIVALQNRATKT